MNPYEPPDDESQLDRIERKLDRLDGSYWIAILTGVTLTALAMCIVKIVLAR